MDKKKLEVFKKRLEERQRELRQTVSRTAQDGREADHETAQDVADRAANSYTKEFLFSQSSNERQILQMVEGALSQYSRGQLWRVHLVWRGNQSQATRGGAVDAPLHRVPGKAGAGFAGTDRYLGLLA